MERLLVTEVVAVLLKTGFKKSSLLSKLMIMLLLGFWKLWLRSELFLLSLMLGLSLSL